MKRILMVAAVLLGMCGYVPAQQNPADAPATKEDVEKYLKLAHSKEMMTKTMEAMAKPMRQMAHEQCMKDKMPADCEARLNKAREDMMARMPLDEIIDAMVPVYQKHLTKRDVDALVAFYSTPTGQKLIKELPEISAEAMQNMIPMLRKSVDKMTQQMQEEIAAMVKESEGKNPKAATQTNN